MLSFSEYIIKRRLDKGLNQAGLASALSLFDEKLFGRASITTISRWENGKEPNNAKKKRVIEFFGDNVNRYFPFTAKKEKINHSCVYDYIKDKKLKDRRESPFFISSILPSSPSDCEIKSLRDCEHGDQYLKIIERSNYEHPVSLKGIAIVKDKAVNVPIAKDHTSHLKPFSHETFPHGVANIFIAECFKNYFGHIAFFKIENDTVENLLRYKVHKMGIQSEHLDKKKQVSPLLVHSIYFSNELAGAMLLCKLYEFVKENRIYINDIYCFSLDRSYNGLLRNMGFTGCNHVINDKPLYRCHISDFLQPEDLAAMKQ